jgi:hypothetical protein
MTNARETSQHLRDMLEKVEQTARLPADDPSLVELKRIIDQRTGELERADKGEEAPPPEH